MKIINGFWLRIVAMTSMVIDHVVLFFAGNDITIRAFGRFAFPIYCLLLADGFLHIKDDTNRLKRNLSKMIALTLFSEFAYDFAEFGFDFESYLTSQSVMFTLLLGYLALIASEKLKDRKFTLVCVYVLVAFTNYLLSGNFNIAGPLLVVAMYWFLQYSSDKSWAKTLLLLFAIFIVYQIIYYWGYCDLGDIYAWTAKVSSRIPWVIAHVFVVLLLSMYNRKLGYHKKWFATLFYIFYPLHLLILGILRWIVFV